MSAAQTNFAFPHAWDAKLLAARPLILPPRHFVYPLEVEEVERGALEVLVRPHGESERPFLATCALGFRDPSVPTGVWSAPNPDHICAVSGGYAYLIDTRSPERFTFLPLRPAMQILPAVDAQLLLFIGHRTILAWGHAGLTWESPKVSDEGIAITSIERNSLHGSGWNMITDKEKGFSLDLQSGRPSQL